METITNLAQSAVKAVWGDGSNKKEPVSGAQGDVAKGEPFDGGNIEADATTASATKDTTPAAEADKQQAPAGTDSNAVSGAQVPLAGEPALAKAQPSSSSSVKDVKGSKDVKDVKDKAVAAVVVDQASKQKPKEVQVPPKESAPAKPQPSTTTTTASAKDVKDNKNNIVVVDKAAKQPTTQVSPTKESAPAKPQPSTTTATTTTTTTSSSSSTKDVKDNKNNIVVDKAAKQPTTQVSPAKESAPVNSQPSRTADSKDNSNIAPAAKKDDEKQVTGPGPKPLATVAKENGGDAGNARPDSKSKSKPKTPESPKQAAASNKDAQEKGTGDLYVKTSGLAADGGNFDVTKPGAGKEADRLMEEKGLHRETANSSKAPKSDAAPSSAANNGQKAHEKPSIKDRVKDKLHINKD
ncbi:hypothetical protein E4U42_003819 [Claviceps africana]|uniref:Uncharacterized protein n=1 Tax=Claviceps africana TaxID=83212 RepID=A0A8K0J8X5_9HYPO|nr:hypothetical protein E4U42_003819 [Claviceps africana]